MIEVNFGGQRVSVACPVVPNHVCQAKTSIGKSLQPLGISELKNGKMKNQIVVSKKMIGPRKFFPPLIHLHHSHKYASVGLLRPSSIYKWTQFIR